MRSSTSSSEARFLLAFAATVIVLLSAWEIVLRLHSGATLEFAIQRPPMTTSTARGEKWVVFGNCLVLTGISPKQLGDELDHDHDRAIFNIAAHEQSPIAYFDYLDRAHVYPDVIIANVSSWIRSTNFEQESALVAKTDPLSLAPAMVATTASQQAYHHDDSGGGKVQKQIEDTLAHVVTEHVWSIGHRYHLFDYSIFLWSLLTTRDLEAALYQLNIQSWFSVASSETDGDGFVGIHVRYRDDWTTGLDQMADRYLKRMRLSNLLTDRYWQLLGDDIRSFQRHGTRVLLVRMPEHPRIREFNDEHYELPQHLAELQRTTGAPVLDLSRLGPADGVRLFDSVHPDGDAATVITRAIATWVRSLKPDQSPPPSH